MNQSAAATGDRSAEASACLSALCEQGHRVWEKCLSLAAGTDEQVVILQTHHHIVEQLDAAALLLAAGSVEAAKLHLRATFEALLTLTYVLQTDTTRRAYAWLVAVDILERIKTWARLDPETESGRQFAMLQKEEGLELPTIVGVPAKERRSKLRTMLETDSRWTEAYAEYRRLRKGNYRPEWYEMFGGPKGRGLRDLAIHLGQGTHYEIIYRLWSRRMHGTDVVQRLRPGPDGTVLIAPLRYIGDLDQVLNFGVSFGLKSIRLLLEYYCPEDCPAFAKWYVHEFRPKWPLFFEQDGPDPIGR